MKTKSIMISGLLVLVLTLVLSSFIYKTNLNSSKTEEYAIIDVSTGGKTKYIRVTKGTEHTTETGWKSEKTEYHGDYTPVITALNQLNEQGFELLNTSFAINKEGGTRQTFMMVKKIK